MRNARKVKLVAAVLVAFAALAGRAPGAELALTAIPFPEGTDVDVPFKATGIGPHATVNAEVRYRTGQARIELTYRGMEPALLFGGDVSSYVVWAVTRDGVTDNLGELIVRGTNDDPKFSTGKKEFAILITAESFPFVERPSEAVIFYSQPSTTPGAAASSFPFSAFAPAPRSGFDSIAGIQYKEKIPIDVRQAERILAFAGRIKAGDVNPTAFGEAKGALALAQKALDAGEGRKVVIDHSRRAVSLASEAIRDTYRKAAADEAAAAAARKKAELDALAQKATDAERARRESEQALSEAEAARRSASQQATEAEKARRATEQALTEAEAARRAASQVAAAAESARLEATRTAAEAEKARQAAEAASAQAKVDIERLAREREQLKKERDELAQRLSNALGTVAETRDSARGVILSLSSGILFDVNKSVLKPPAREALAKLTGILLMLPGMNLRVEGYTDSTGAEETNRKLSAERARSVVQYMKEQGLSESRMKFEGYGPANPVAPNDTADGRARNRRVEVVIAEGEVKAAGN